MPNANQQNLWERKWNVMKLKRRHYKEINAEEYYKMFTWQLPFTENSYFLT